MVKEESTYSTAYEMGGRQREISVSEFFLKNRHLLGFDSPSKALLTTVREAVDNALDACEEAGVLPEIRVEVAIEGRYQKGLHSVDMYFKQTAIASPYVSFHYQGPRGEAVSYTRSSTELPPWPSEIKPHPHGVELGHGGEKGRTNATDR